VIFTISYDLGQLDRLREELERLGIREKYVDEIERVVTTEHLVDMEPILDIQIAGFGVRTEHK